MYLDWSSSYSLYGGFRAFGATEQQNNLLSEKDKLQNSRKAKLRSAWKITSSTPKRPEQALSHTYSHLNCLLVSFA